MKKLLEEIYFMVMETAKFKYATIGDEENEAYESIYNTLTEKQKSVFDRFIELLSSRYCDDGERLFYEGFKLAFKLFIELLYEQ